MADAGSKSFREEMLEGIVASGLDRESAEVTLRRIADRLGGYSHEEVAEMHPLPDQEAERG